MGKDVLGMSRRQVYRLKAWAQAQAQERGEG